MTDMIAAKNVMPKLVHIFMSNGNKIFSNDVYKSPGGTNSFGLKQEFFDHETSKL